MATYVFRSESGREVEVERPMTDAPKFGEPLELGGVVYYRVPTIPEARVSINPHFVSHSLPLAQRKPDGSLYSPYSKNVDPETLKPRFGSWKDVREAEGFSKHNDGERAVVYD
jgi:hypothetical protein